MIKPISADIGKKLMKNVLQGRRSYEVKDDAHSFSLPDYASQYVKMVNKMLIILFKKLLPLIPTDLGTASTSETSDAMYPIDQQRAVAAFSSTPFHSSSVDLIVYDFGQCFFFFYFHFHKGEYDQTE